ncbi:MAG: VanW family protein [Lachnospiraceae bacterium]
MKKKKILIPILCVVCVLGIAIGAFAFLQIRVKAHVAPEGVITEHISIGNVDVSNMKLKEAHEAVKASVDKIRKQKFTIQAGEKTLQATAEELGVVWENEDVVQKAERYAKTGNLFTRYKEERKLEKNGKTFPLSYTVDATVAKQYLTKQQEVVNQDPVDGSLSRVNGTFQITEGKNGIALNVNASLKKLQHFFDNWDGKTGQIQLISDVKKPKGNKQTLEQVTDVLGTYTTDYSSSAAGRKTNVQNGTSKINGALLYPGESFSVYEAVSPFDAEHGYALAGSYENGTTVETYGGGICQVSTTLYNAVIRAELEVTERFNHSLIVHYVKPSEDAAIAGTYKDLKFKNNLDTPVYIEGAADGANVRFTIYGHETRPANREVSFESEIIKEIPSQTIEVPDGTKPVGYRESSGSAHTGYVAKLWKIVTVDGKEESREEFNYSEYKSTNVTVTVGTMQPEPEPSEPLDPNADPNAPQDPNATQDAGEQQPQDANVQQEEEKKKQEQQREEENKEQEQQAEKKEQ